MARKFGVVLSAALLVFSLVGTAGAAAVYVTGVSSAGGWSDVNKTSVSGSPDSFLCWAAAASDAIAYTGWRGWDSGSSSYISTAGDIYSRYVAAWSNGTGSPVYAYEWWLTNRTTSNVPGHPFPSAGLNFYPGVDVLTGASVTAFVNSSTGSGFNPYPWIDTYINANRGVVIGIDVPSGPGVPGAYQHALTVWGWDTSLHKIFLTDSDDGLTALRTYDFYTSGNDMFISNYSNRYTSATNVKISEVTRLNRNDTGIQPNGWTAGPGPGPEPVPEPGTMLLLGSGLVGLAGMGRRKMKK